MPITGFTFISSQNLDDIPQSIDIKFAGYISYPGYLLQKLFEIGVPQIWPPGKVKNSDRPLLWDSGGQIYAHTQCALCSFRRAFDPVKYTVPGTQTPYTFLHRVIENGEFC